MTARVVIVDYGMGNVLSVQRAVEHCDAQAVLSASPADIDTATHVILPGVGAFRDGMAALTSRGLVEPLKHYAREGRPFLGICLGMQMLFDESDEFGRHAGLGLLPGRVEAIPKTTADNRAHKVPHIAWTPLEAPAGEGEDYWNGSILDGLPVKTAAYFVHSFTAVPAERTHRLADAHYNGRLISAAVHNGKISGTQFHPEKSAQNGLAILRQFLNQTPT